MVSDEPIGAPDAEFGLCGALAPPRVVKTNMAPEVASAGGQSAGVQGVRVLFRVVV